MRAEMLIKLPLARSHPSVSVHHFKPGYHYFEVAMYLSMRIEIAYIVLKRRHILKIIRVKWKNLTTRAL
jgi:hypothetical protein